MAGLIYTNEYLASFPGATLSDKIGVTELDKKNLNIMLNSWSKQSYVQGFYCESTTFNKVFNMFERMDIV